MRQRLHPHPGHGWIYCLLEPDKNEIRYVGQTKRAGGPADRLYYHLYSARLPSRQQRPTHLTSWLLALEEKSPRVQVLAIVPVKQLNVAEIQWITYLRSLNCDLTNTTSGGTGGPIRLGMKTPSETLAKQNAARLLRPRVSESTRIKMSAVPKTRPAYSCPYCGNRVQGLGNFSQHKSKHQLNNQRLMRRSIRMQLIGLAAPSSCVLCRRYLRNRKYRGHHLRYKHNFYLSKTS